MKLKEKENKDNQQDEVLNINPILSNIFSYTDYKDLIEFNTVCKKWNTLTNPIIHKTIKLIRRNDVIGQIHENRLNKAAETDVEVSECISYNAKHANLVKEFNFHYKLWPRRLIEVFETFRFVTNLTIDNCEMGQDQFLSIFGPLDQLQELTLSSLRISRIIYKIIHKEAVLLPQALKKLKLSHIILIENYELFIQTVNSHNNLVEFNSVSHSNNEFLEPFYKHYPSLLTFELDNIGLQTLQSLFTIFENNPQLISLKLSLRYWDVKLLSHINSYLINLEELDLSVNDEYNSDYTDFFDKLSQPTKIKKLNLDWLGLSNCSLNSILLNCPNLEALTLNRSTLYKQPNSLNFINFSKSAKLKKLAIDCDDLSEGVFDSILLSCSHLNELDIILPREWKEAIKSIHEKCENLKRLEISQPKIYEQERDTFYREFYESGLFTNSHKCKFTLTHLTLNGFKAADSKAEYFKNFVRLKYIKYLNQLDNGFYSFNRVTEVDMNLWPGYQLLINDSFSGSDAILKRYRLI